MIKDPIFSTLKKSSKSLRPAAGNQGQLVLQLLQLLWSRSLPACLPARLLQHLKEGNPLQNPLKRSCLGALPHQVQPETFGPRFCFSKALPLHPKAHLGPVTLTLSPIWGLDLAHYRNHFRPTSGHQGPLDGQI